MTTNQPTTKIKKVAKAAKEKLNGKKGKNLHPDTDKWIDEGKKKMHEVQDELKVYTDEIIKAVQEKPLTSVLIAGGVGFILSSLFRK